MVVSIFIIHIFCICTFIYSQKLMCSSKISISKQFPRSLINMGMYACSRKLESPGVHVLNWGWRRHNPASCCNFYTVNQCLLCCPISNIFLTFVCISLVILLLKLLLLFSYQDVSDSLRPYELQHTRLPCPSPSPGVCPNSCPLTVWCHTTISSAVTLFSSIFNLPVSGVFQITQLFASGGQSIGASTSASVLPKSIQGWFPLGLTGLISLLSKESQESFLAEHTVEVTNRFKGLDLVNRVPEELWTEVHNIVQEEANKIIPKEKTYGPPV